MDPTEEVDARSAPMSFIVRISADAAGRLSGVVERVATGAKERFHGVEAIGAVIARMVREGE